MEKPIGNSHIKKLFQIMELLLLYEHFLKLILREYYIISGIFSQVGLIPT